MRPRRPLLCLLTLSLLSPASGRFVPRQLFGPPSTTPPKETPGNTLVPIGGPPDQPTATATTPAASSTTSLTSSNTHSSSVTTASSSTLSSSSVSASTSSQGSSASSSGTTQPAQIVTTGSLGDAITITETQSADVSSSVSSPSASQTGGTGDSGGGLGTGSIVGLSVAGGVALLGIIAFFVWKFTRKRFADYEHDEAIKWPELNTHHGKESHALPLTNTGRAGFGAGSSDLDIPQGAAHLGHLPDDSTHELGPDPYGVPPLPHLNPNLPYRDYPDNEGYYDTSVQAYPMGPVSRR